MHEVRGVQAQQLLEELLPAARGHLHDVHPYDDMGVGKGNHEVVEPLLSVGDEPRPR